MKIDIGNGKILGTKRVSPNGQVSGFTEYAGREVLVLLPEDDAEVHRTPRDVLRDLREAAGQHVELEELAERLEAWVREQADETEDRLRRAKGRIDKARSTRRHHTEETTTEGTT